MDQLNEGIFGNKKGSEIDQTIKPGHKFSVRDEIAMFGREIEPQLSVLVSEHSILANPGVYIRIDGIENYIKKIIVNEPDDKYIHEGHYRSDQLARHATKKALALAESYQEDFEDCLTYEECLTYQNYGKNSILMSGHKDFNPSKWYCLRLDSVEKQALWIELEEVLAPAFMWQAYSRKDIYNAKNSVADLNCIYYNAFVPWNTYRTEEDNEAELRDIYDELDYKTEDQLRLEDKIRRQKDDGAIDNGNEGGRKDPKDMTRQELEDLELADRKLLSESFKDEVKDEDTPPVVIGFGRCNPNSLGHNSMFHQMKEKADELGAYCQYYLSHSYDGFKSGKFKPGKCKNPLPYKSKLKYCRDAAPDVTFVESQADNFYAVLADAYNKGSREVYIYCGDDRVSEYEKAQIYNGTLPKSDPNYFDFDVLEVINAGVRDDESDDPVEKASASLLRQLCLDRNYEEFKKYAGTEKLTKEMYEELSEELGIYSSDMTPRKISEFLSNHVY